ncbi:hypothetical protein SAMN05444411_101895 [Lutibacter oricola]|uniref:Lipocalin-like domain-containing protein n=1 Tax=Lutibacter oricola TaxID=762486 RepID=A0A1H2U7Q4_9FLAO|nr:hypothetical protein [Lutibacter oricola]SDW51474.1 hypothetical protein SAMN05444411_101895 [Lutibacter oricola]
MKTLFKIALLILTISFSSCDNDNPTTPNLDDCNYAGFTFYDNTNTTQTLIPESDLTTDYFNTSSNGPEVEIYKTTDPGNFWFVTQVLNLNGTGTGQLSVNGTIYNVNVTCQRAGTAVGEELRFDITASGLEAEYCVVIDLFH